jgi:hypothetical protein
MQIEKLRSLIRESINEYIREIDDQGTGAMFEAKKQACEAAIEKREAKLRSIDENEELKEMVDNNKLKEIQKEINELKKYHKKLEKLQSKHSNKGKKKEMTTDAKTDEEAPVEEADITAEMNMDEEPLNESFLKMQKLAGVITETQYNQKKKILVENQVNENTKHTELKPLEDILIEKGYTFYKDDVGFSGKATYEKGDDEISLFKDYEEDMGADRDKTFPVRILNLRNNKTLLDKNCNSIDDAKNILSNL